MDATVMDDLSDKLLANSKCAVIVAHPDDETLWAGGTILMNPDNDWTIITLCRGDDKDRNPKFHAVLKILNANGMMGTVDDGPEQIPLDMKELENTVLSLLTDQTYDLIITHSTEGEYTRHRRHEEVAQAVTNLINSEQLKTKHLWMFAYEDGQRAYLPRAIAHTDHVIGLPLEIWNKKHEIITEIYGFAKDSWEARTTPRKESFWSFRSVKGIQEWIRERSVLR